jgi:hypothetical protein
MRIDATLQDGIEASENKATRKVHAPMLCLGRKNIAPLVGDFEEMRHYNR